MTIRRSRSVDPATALALALAVGILPPAGCGDDTAAGDDAPDIVADGDADAEPDPLACAPRTTPLALDSPPPAGQAVVGFVTSASELIGGEGAFSRVGHAWKLANATAAFVVQDAFDPDDPTDPSDRAFGYTLYGGSLVDADVQRPDGGQDLLREILPIAGWRLPSSDAVSVLCDGNGGRAAVLRFEGMDSPSIIIPQIDGLAPTAKNVRIVTDYILEPDSYILRIRTQATNLAPRPYGDFGFGDVLLFGTTNTLFTVENGFGAIDTNPMWIAATSDPGHPTRNTSYAYATEHGMIRIPMSESGLTGGLGYITTLPAGGTETFERYLAVGSGGVSGAVEPLLERLGAPYAVVTGTVTKGGAPQADAAVVAFRSGEAPGTRRAAGQAVTADDGAYRLVVPAGDYVLVAAKAGCIQGTGEIGPIAEGASATADIALGPCGSVTLDIREGAAPCPAKVTFRGIDAPTPERQIGPVIDEVEPGGANRLLFTPDGSGTYPVKPGRYSVLVSRGPEYAFVEQPEVVVPEDGAVTVAATLERVVDSTDWIAADFHIHTNLSPDGSVSVCHRVLETVTEGLEYAVSTDHDGYADYLPCVDSLGLAAWTGAMVGCEVSNVGRGGHRNAYPMPYDPADPFRNWGPQYWAVLTSQRLNDKLHAEPTDPVVQMNHPRAIDSYTNWIQFDPVLLTTERGELATGFEAIETSNGANLPFDSIEQLTADWDDEISAMAHSGLDRDRVPVFRDYLGFLALGWNITAVGTSDQHHRSGTGYSRSYLRLDHDDPAAVTEEQVKAAVRDSRVVVANGAFLRVVTEGSEVMGPNEVVAMTGAEVHLYVEAQAVPGIDLSTLHVLANGRPLYLRREADRITAEETAAGGGSLSYAIQPEDGLDEVVRLAIEVVHAATRDTFYHVFVVGSGSLSPLPSSGPFAYTNAIYVDVDGGGFGM